MSVHSAMAAFVAALIVTTVATPVVRRMATRAGVVDEPGGRRVHATITPRLGGVAVMTGFFATLIAFAVVKTTIMRSFMERPNLMVGLVLGGLVVGAVGAIDDVRSLGPWMKLAAQAVAAIIAYAFGYTVEAVNLPFFGEVHLGAMALPLTVLWFLAITNAVNLIDGLDGLATGIALFTTVANCAISYVRGVDTVLLLSAALGGSLLGFLRYNFNPATIFLGDSGSMFLGYTLAATSIGGQLTKSSTAVTLLAPVLALGVPIVDTLLAMVRRTLARQSIFAADRGHIHHRLLDLGFTHRRVVLTLHGLSVALAVCAVAVAIGHARDVGFALGAVGLILFTTVRRAIRQRPVMGKVHLQHSSPELEQLRSARDEVTLRTALNAWSIRSDRFRAELFAGEAPLDAGGTVVSYANVSSATRRRYLRVAADSAQEREQEGVPIDTLNALAEACRYAIERIGSTSEGTGRLSAISPHAPGADK